jgi:DNA modification methylase
VTATVLRGNALALPLADESVDLIATSPPYFAMRSYLDGGEHYAGQIGSEESPHEFLDALIDATAEMVRVIKPSGSIWVNLGDKYCSPGGHTDRGVSSRLQGRRAQRQQARADRTTTGHNVRPKSLFGLPWRYAIRCIDELGLILRAEVIWEKPNGLPESVTDRVRRSHEQWFHLTKSPRYFSAIDEIREPHSAGTHAGRSRSVGSESGNGVRHRTFAGDTDSYSPLGRPPGSVWEVPTQPLAAPAELGVDHFAAFPLEWPRRIIRGWSPTGICTACGDGRRPTTSTEQVAYRAAGSTGRPKRQALAGNHQGGQNGIGYPQTKALVSITGYACSCPDDCAPTRPAVVLDPFGGTGTTALAARALGRHGISVDMSGDYCRLATWRIGDPGELARAMQVEKPPVEPAGMGSLLDLIGEGA